MPKISSEATRRLEALEAERLPVAFDIATVTIRVADARRGGCGVRPDRDVIGAAVENVSVVRNPGETIRALRKRAALLSHAPGVPVVFLKYRIPAPTLPAGSH